MKYAEADIFVYEESPRAVYMAYMDYKNLQEKAAIEPTRDNHEEYSQGNLNNLLQKVEMITSQAIMP